MIKHQRFIWASSIINAKKNDRLLEIGCGAGILVELLAAGLSGGMITAVDQSKPMIILAQKRNNANVDSGKVKLLHQSFHKATFEQNAFDKVLGFNVNFFRNDAVHEIPLIHACLNPRGKLFVFYQTPGGTSHESLAVTIQKNVDTRYFQVQKIIYGESEQGVCVIFTPVKT
jgi:SAM-dependent methyltransferase